MARVLIRTQAWGPVTNAAGLALPNLSYVIKNTDGTAATHWSAETGGTSSTATLTTDADGGPTLSGTDRWIEPGKYDVAVNGKTYRVTTSSANLPDFWLPTPSGDTTGVTDTAAIQAAINAASGGNYSARVVAQSSPLAPYYFTNLTIPKGVSLEGGGPFGARLVRAAGATGTAIVDTGVNGATGISLRRLFIDGNSTAGNGIDLGNQSGKPDWNSFAVIEDVVVENFTSGIGYNLNPDAVTVRNISAVNNNQGIVTTGHGSNGWYFIFLSGNLTNDLVLGSSNELIYGIHVEPKTSGSSIVINSGAAFLFGINGFCLGNIGNLIEVGSGIGNIMIQGVINNLNGHTATNLLSSDSWGNLTIPGSVVNLGTWAYGFTEGSFYLNSAKGKGVRMGDTAGLSVSEGTNAKQGTATLVGGTATVANTSVTSTSRIFLTSQQDGGTPGFLRVSARTAGTSFTITSSSGTDTSTVAWEMFEVGP